VRSPDGERVRRIFSDPPVFFVRELSSTSDTLRNWVSEGLVPPGATLLCALQTGGRGRPGNRWHSRRGDLTMSRWIPPQDLPPSRAFPLPLVVAAGCLTLLDDLGIPGIFWKYPNDLYALLSPGDPGGGEGKLGGILVETVRESGGASAGWIAGIGINMGTPPPEGGESESSPLRVKAASLSALTGAGVRLPGPLALAGLFSRRIEELLYGSTPDDIRRCLEDRLLWKDRWVVYSFRGKTAVGRIESLGEQGELLLTGDDGRPAILGPGVRNLRPVSGGEGRHGL